MCKRFKCNCKVNGWEALLEISDGSRGFPYKLFSLDAPCGYFKT